MAEILLTTVVISISAAMVVPLLNTSNEKVQSAASAIFSDLNYAKQQAMLLGEPITVTFDASTLSYSICDDSETPIINPHTKADYVVTLPSVNMTIDMDSASNEVTFNSLGNLDTGGTITLSDTNSVIYTISLSITGTINITSN